MFFNRKYDESGLPDGHHIDIQLKGSAGQSFCAFLVKGVTCTLEGDANDYVGKITSYRTSYRCRWLHCFVVCFHIISFSQLIPFEKGIKRM